ncbi:hypothetical protein N752_30180 [Desulforamulus aquiferis]|nr:hypothetical protein N752_30180 [Desulforamulus aquiferis]
MASRLKKALKAPRKVRENLWVWSPVVLPFQGYPAVRYLNKLLISCWLNFWLFRLRINKDLLWTYNPLTTRLINYKGYNKLIYHCVDEIKAQPGMPVEILEKTEQELVELSDIVFVTAPKLFETRKEWNPKTYYFPNVADFDHFSKALDSTTEIPSDLINISSPRIGFIGAISGYKVDFNLLRFVAESRPDWSLILIGKVGEGDPWTNSELLTNLPNVHLLGPRSYKELPNYLKGFDVALLPNMLNEYTESMFPMKFFEYLAAGKAVISVELPALQDFQNVVYIAKSPIDFIKGIKLSLDGLGSELEERLNIARKYTYKTRTEEMMKIVNNDGRCLSNENSYSP